MNQVLVVDDEAAMRTALEANFRRSGWKVITAGGADEAITKFKHARVPLVVTDMRMPDGDGLRVMQGVRAVQPDTAVIFLTAYGSVPEAVLAMQEGACDYLVKPISFEQLRKAAKRVLGQREDSAGEDGGGKEQFVGTSPLVRSLLERARRAARSDADILMEAESGTGKELLARLIHQVSSRSKGPFVAVNCAAFPETLLESELFGHVRGAFTGATASRPGKFEQANGGTILLDEIGEMPLSLQPKLLRVLQEREVDRLGDTRTIPVDVRVIATTNRPLLALIEEGKFRADLYYRLNVVPLTVPPLRARREDILVLAEHFLQRYAPRTASPPWRLSPGLLERLKAYEWPGNVRELENVIRRSLALAAGPVIDVEEVENLHLFPTIPGRPGRAAVQAGMSLRELERQLLEKTLDATGGNRTRAAEMMGVSLRTIRNKIREFGLPPRRYA